MFPDIITIAVNPNFVRMSISIQCVMFPVLSSLLNCRSHLEAECHYIIPNHPVCLKMFQLCFERAEPDGVYKADTILARKSDYGLS
ncbi:hypothetical protein KC356_g146 [Hortaea werneckii]|nr:hypothetical protein KC356_g146 [Hortaea werneckii]